MIDLNRKQMMADAEYLKGIADGLDNDRLRRCAEYLEKCANDVCAMGYLGCHLGERCDSEHK